MKKQNCEKCGQPVKCDGLPPLCHDCTYGPEEPIATTCFNCGATMYPGDMKLYCNECEEIIKKFEL